MTVTFLSNGHGEDASGALLAAELLRRRPNLRVSAFPTVDEGRAYEKLDIPILGPRRVMPSGGLLMHRYALFAQDLQAGFLSMTYQQVLELRRLRPDVLVVVGDLYALLLSSLVRTKARFLVQTLVSAHHFDSGRALEKLTHPNRLFMERIGGPERALMRRLARHVYVRDAATAAFLQSKGLGNVSALGNPSLDALAGEAMLEHADAPLRVALLPGTRSYAPAALTMMLSALAEVPEATGLVAWAGETLPPPPSPWILVHPPNSEGLTAIYVHGEQKVHVYENRFADILHTAQLVLGTSGTANEQAAALGRPVVAFPVPPLYSAAFLRNQQRLLGAALRISEPQPAAIAAALRAFSENEVAQKCAAAAGTARLGEPGGTRAIVTDVLARAFPLCVGQRR